MPRSGLSVEPSSRQLDETTGTDSPTAQNWVSSRIPETGTTVQACVGNPVLKGNELSPPQKERRRRRRDRGRRRRRPPLRRLRGAQRGAQACIAPACATAPAAYTSAVLGVARMQYAVGGHGAVACTALP
jgi:hypothetical protein